MLNSLPIIPFVNSPFGNLHLPGSKSITNRSLLLAALSSNCVEIHNALISEDTLLMIDALKALGFALNVNKSHSTIAVKGLCGKIPKNTATIYVGNAGTLARFITAFLCLHPSGTYYLDGSAAMRKRPMKPLLDALISIGAATISYHGNPGHFPFTLKTHGIQGGEILLDASTSSQVLSAILMIAPLASDILSIQFMPKVVSWPFIEMTMKMMQIFGQSQLSVLKNDTFLFTKFSPYSFPSEHYFVEPDATAASYFLALVLILGGQLKLPGLCFNNSLQGDLSFATVLQSCGLQCESFDNSLNVKRIANPSLSGLSANFSSFSDTFLTLAAIAPLLKSPTHISGIGHTRFQETDRIAAVTTELRKLNQQVIETRDSLTIVPQRLKPTTIDTYNDHRIAMSFAILGSFDLLGSGVPWLRINNPSCCDKTFPNFFNTLENMKTLHHHAFIS